MFVCCFVTCVLYVVVVDCVRSLFSICCSCSLRIVRCLLLVVRVWCLWDVVCCLLFVCCLMVGVDRCHLFVL